ncbi:MAG: DHH family phosphoesterase [Candidatus Gracilibacteria bacterium]|jgi:phosphoesterase RecJ-like protein
MQKYIQEFEQIKNLIRASHNIAIISHKGPDGDTVGSNLALKHALTAMGKNAVSFAKDPIPLSVSFLSGSNEFQTELNAQEFDMIIAMDCGASYMMKYEFTHPQIVNIDHHPSNDFFGLINVVDSKMAATVSIIYFLLEYLGANITPEIATCLLNGLYSDTGSFRHSNTDSLTLKIASNLVAKGADYKTIVKHQFHSNRVDQLKLWGRVLSRTRLNEKSAAVSAVTEKDFDELNTNAEDLSGVIDYLNTIPESKFCVLLAEDGKGNIKGSFRTQDEKIDLTQIAGLFGGGGHKKAAGFTIPGKLEQEVVWKIKK